jgi:4-amino-4-deoxy-L-arabinose transferase-like glycosyltransferase
MVHSELSHRSRRSFLRPYLWNELFVLGASLLLFLSVVGLLAVAAAMGARGLFTGSASYGETAAQLLGGTGFSSTYRPPLYPLQLSFLMGLFGERWEAAAWVLQGGLTVLTGLLVVDLSMALTKRTAAGGVAALLYATHLVLQIELLTRRESCLYLFLTLLFMYGALCLSFSARKSVFLAAVGGLLHLTRPNGIFFLGLALVLVLIERSGVNWRAKCVHVLLTAALFFAVIAPWQFTIYRLTGKIGLTSSTTSGLNLWKGNNPFIGWFVPLLDVDRYEPWARREIGGGDIYQPEGDQLLGARARAFISESPGRFVANGVLKVLFLFSPVPTPWGSGTLEGDPPLRVTGFQLRNIPIGLWATLHALILGIGIVVAGMRGELSQLGIPFLVCTLYLLFVTAAVCFLTFSETRFRLPLDPILIIPAALGLVSLADRRGRRNR